jgi:hypothetical protein
MGLSMKRLTRRLEVLQRNEHPGNLATVAELQQEIDHLLEMEDIWWKQRAKRTWYQHGDRNTQFFHAWATQRRMMNRLHKVQDEEGAWWSEQEDMGAAFSQYFQNLFTSKGSVGLEECIKVVPTRVTPPKNEELLREFTDDEVDRALFQMHPVRAPGPDGFGVCFFQKHWETIGGTVRRTVLEFLNNGNFDHSLNSTHIVLIPKTPNA